MKHIRIAVLILINMFILCAAAYAKTPDSKKCGEFLYELGVMDESYSDDELQEGLTRAEFAVMAAKLTGQKDIKTNERYFVDVPMDHWAGGYINYLVETRSVTVSEDKMFRHGDFISVNEALKIVLQMTHYGVLSEVSGGFPSGYQKVAADLDLTVRGGDGDLTKKQALVLLFEVMNIEMYDSNKSLMQCYFNVYKTQGIVTQAGGISLNTLMGSTPEDKIKDVAIDNVLYNSKINLDDFLGRKITVFYQMETNTEMSKIIWADCDTKKEEVININVDDYIEYSRGEITYYNDVKKKKIEIPQSAVIVKNGQLAWSDTSEVLNNVNKGTIRVIDNNNDDNVDYIIINEYKNIVVERISQIDFLVYDAIVKTDSVCLNTDEKTVIIKDFSGADKTFSDIKIGQVLSIYESDEYLKVIIGADGVGGVFYGSTTDEDDVLLEIGKNEKDKSSYKIDPDYYNNYFKDQGSFAYNANITYYLDVAGNVAYMTVGAPGDGWIVGYLVKCITDENDDGLGLKIKVFTQHGELATYLVSDKITVDGNRKQTSADVIKSMDKVNMYGKTLTENEDRVNGQVIRFKLNGNSEIVRIDTENFDKDKEDVLSLNRSSDLSTLRYWYYISGFTNGKIMYDGQTVRFEVPAYAELSSADSDDFCITSGDYRDVEYKAESYKFDVSDVYSDVIVVVDSPGMYLPRGPYIIENVAAVWDETEEEVVKQITVLDPTTCAKLSLKTKPGYDLSDGNGVYADKGDIIRAKVGRGGKVEGITMYYDYSRKDDESYNVSTGWKIGWAPTHDQEYTMVYSYIKNMTKKGARLVYSSELQEEDFSAENVNKADFTTVINSENILIYDGKFVTTGSWQDIVPVDISGVDNPVGYWLVINYGRVVGVICYR